MKKNFTKVVQEQNYPVAMMINGLQLCTQGLDEYSE